MEPNDATVRAEALASDSRWIRGIARSLLADPGAADDLVQDAWIAALAQEPATRPDAQSPRPWLARVLRNLAGKHWRNGSRRLHHETAGAHPEALASTAELVARAETQRLVVDAVLALDEPYRTAILLAHIEGLSSVEIGRNLGVSSNTVRWRIHHGLSRLRLELERRRGHEWLGACALLLPAVDRDAILAASKVAGTCVAAGVIPKVAAATAGAFVLAGGAAMTWRAVNPHEAEPETASARIESPLPDTAIGAASDPEQDAPRVPEFAGEFVHSLGAPSNDATLFGLGPAPDNERLQVGESVRTALTQAIGDGQCADAVTDVVMQKLDEVLTAIRGDPNSLGARVIRLPGAAFALSVDDVDLPMCGTTRPGIFVDVHTAPSR